MHNNLGNASAKIASYIVDHLFDILNLISILLVSRMLQAALSIKDFNYLIIIFLFAAGIVLYCFYEKCLRTNKYMIIFTIFIVLAISSIYCFYKPFASYIHTSFTGNLSQITNEIMLQKYTYFSQFMPFFICIIPISAAAITALNKKGFGFLSIIFTLSIVFFLWYNGYDLEIKFYLYPYAIICMLIWGINTYERHIKKAVLQGYRVSLNEKNVLKLTTLVCLPVILLSFLSAEIFGIKSIPEAMNDAVLKDMKVQESIKRNKYGLQLSGYNDSDNKLGGSVIPDTTIAFRVKCSEPMYLKGMVKILYDGSMWKEKDGDQEEFYGGALPDLNQNFDSTVNTNQRQSSVKDELSKRSITIYPENLVTSSIFTPPFASSIHMDGIIFSIDGIGNLTIKNSVSVKKSYTVDYYESSSGIEEFSKGYDSGYSISYEDTDKEYSNIKDCYYMYLEVPDNISPQIYSLVKSITRDCRSSSEKVIRIQDYLSENYKYSLDVSDIPRGKEFLDYFLFTEKKGYCTYFATACTIFCRIAGIPARYVEGFKMQDKKDANGLYIVSNDMAHAWTEVLVDPDKNIWSIVDAVPSDSRAVMQDYIASMPASTSGDTTAKKYGSASKISPNKNEPAAGVSIWPVLEAVSYTAAALFILYIIWSIVYCRRKIAAMLSSKSMVPVYHYTKERLQSCKIQSSMIQDDIKWINSISDMEFKKQMENMISSVYAEYYGNKYDARFDRYGFYKYLEHYIRNKENILKYLVLKYMLRIDFKQHIFFTYFTHNYFEFL